MAKKSNKPRTVSELIIDGKTTVMQSLIGAEMAVLSGKNAKETFEIIKPILEQAMIDLQGASNLLHGYPCDEE